MENKPHKALISKSIYTKQLTYKGCLRIDPQELLKNRKVKRQYFCVCNSSIYLLAFSYKQMCDWQEKEIIKIANTKCNELNKKEKEQRYTYVRYRVNATRQYDDMLIIHFTYTIEKEHHTEKQYRPLVEC